MEHQEKKCGKDDILTIYIDYVLSKDKRPKSIFKFCKKKSINEQDFYASFGSLPEIEIYFWNQILQSTNNIINKEHNEEYPLEHELLTFYFTLLENLSLNRSAVLFFLKRSKNNPIPEAQLRKVVLPHLKPISSKIKCLIHQLSANVGDKLYEEALWIQFISILKFWSNDTSPEFENTDVFIEKTVKLSFELHNAFPVESIVDYGKFLYKEFKHAI